MWEQKDKTRNNAAVFKEPDVEITPAMIQAGVNRFLEISDIAAPFDLVSEVYRAMVAARGFPL